MRFLVDAQLPPAMCRWLRAQGHDAAHVAELGLLAAPDAAIAARAQAAEEILLSKDEDFLWLRLPDRFALVWLRIGNATNHALLLWLAARWDQVVRALEDGERLIEVR